MRTKLLRRQKSKPLKTNIMFKDLSMKFVIFMDIRLQYNEPIFLLRTTDNVVCSGYKL